MLGQLADRFGRSEAGLEGRAILICMLADPLMCEQEGLLILVRLRQSVGGPTSGRTSRRTRVLSIGLRQPPALQHASRTCLLMHLATSSDRNQIQLKAQELLPSMRR